MCSISPRIPPCSQDWLELPRDILLHIFNRLGNLHDQVRFSMVCHSWRDFANTVALPPCLLLPPAMMESTTQSFLSYPYSRTLNFELPELQNKSLYPTSRGSWFLLLALEPEITLFNIITSRKICLPPLTTIETVHFDPSEIGKEYSVSCTNRKNHRGYTGKHSLRAIRDTFIQKAVLSSSSKDPFSEIMMIVVNCGLGYVYFCRPGGERWYSLILHHSIAKIYDLAYSTRYFFIMDYGGRIQVLPCSELNGTSDLATLSFSLLSIPNDLQPAPRAHGCFLAGSQRGLFLIRATKSENSAVKYDVFGLEFSQQHGPLWLRMSSVTDLAFFIYGWIYGLTFSTTDGVHQFKGNRIYRPAFFPSGDRSLYQYEYIIHQKSLGCDIMVHDIGNRSLGRCPIEWSLERDGQWKAHWFIPSFE